MVDKARASAWAYAIVPLLLYGAVLTLLFPFTADDSYITARYGENLVTRGELAFNPGEHVSALTSPLHALIIAGLYRVTENSVIANKCAAIVAVLAVAVWSMLNLWRRRGPGAAVIFAVIVLPSPYLALWTVGGLETPYVTALITTITLMTLPIGMIEPRAFSAPRTLIIGLLIGLAFMARYDTVVFTMPVAFYVLVRSRNRIAATMAMVPGALIAFAWLVFSESYFHDLLPTSFYVKLPGVRIFTIARNALYLAQFVIVSGLVALPWLARPADTRSAQRTWSNCMSASTRSRWGVVGGLAGAAIYGLIAATKHMMFGYRLFLPFLPSAVLIALEILAERGRAEPREGGGNTAAEIRLRPAVATVVLCAQVGLALVVAFVGINFGLLPRVEYQGVGARDYVKNFIPALFAGAHDARAHWSKQPVSSTRPARVLTFAAGALPYVWRDTYILESLISYRHKCAVDPESADYLQIMVPRLGTMESQLPKSTADFVEVSRQTISFEGSTQNIIIVYNPHAAPNNLPPMVDQACADTRAR